MDYSTLAAKNRYGRLPMIRFPLEGFLSNGLRLRQRLRPPFLKPMSLLGGNQDDLCHGSNKRRRTDDGSGELSDGEEGDNMDGPIPVPLGTRDVVGEVVNPLDPFANGLQIVYPQVFNLRKHQISLGWNHSNLSQLQKGLELLERCHHITQIVPPNGKNEPPKSYRVRICRRCTGNDNVLDLGTYLGQESAILVHDAHEILNGRYEKLLVLTPQDKPFLNLLVAKACARRKQSGVQHIPDVIEWRTRRNSQTSQIQMSAINAANNMQLSAKATAPLEHKNIYRPIGEKPLYLASATMSSTALASFVADKVSGLLLPMSEISAFSYNSSNREWFQEGFQHVLAKALSSPMPSPTSSGSPEKVLAAKSVLLLSSFLSHRSIEMTNLLSRIASQSQGCETSPLFSRVLIALSRIHKDSGQMHQVLKLTSEYISDVESYFWTMMHLDKHPCEQDTGTKSVSEILIATQHFMSESHRLVQMLARMLELIMSLSAFITDAHPECSRWRRVVYELRMFNAVLSDLLTQCCIRLTDFKKSLEFMELSTIITIPSSDFLGFLPPIHKFIGSYSRLEAEELKMRQLMEADGLFLPSPKNPLFLQLLLAAAGALGCIPSPPTLPGRQKLNDSCTLLQLRMLTHVGVLSFAFMYGFHIQLPQNLTVSDVFYQLHETLLSLDPMISLDEKHFLFSCQFRSLFRIANICRDAVKCSVLDIQSGAEIARLALSLLQRSTVRFDLAECYLFWTSQFVSELNNLEHEAVNPPVTVMGNSGAGGNLSVARARHSFGTVPLTYTAVSAMGGGAEGHQNQSQSHNHFLLHSQGNQQHGSLDHDGHISEGQATVAPSGLSSPPRCGDDVPIASDGGADDVGTTGSRIEMHESDLSRGDSAASTDPDVWRHRLEYGADVGGNGHHDSLELAGSAAEQV